MAVPGSTINRLCGSGMDAVGTAARAIKAGETALMIAGGVESMSRAPFVMPKADSAFSRSNAVYDTTIGWRFVNKLMKAQYGIDSMPETADNVAAEFGIARADQDAFALRSQQRWGAANAAGCFRDEIVPVEVAQKKGETKLFDTDEHPRTNTTLEQLAKLKGINGTSRPSRSRNGNTLAPSPASQEPVQGSHRCRAGPSSQCGTYSVSGAAAVVDQRRQDIEGTDRNTTHHQRQRNAQLRQPGKGCKNQQSTATGRHAASYLGA